MSDSRQTIASQPERVRESQARKSFSAAWCVGLVVWGAILLASWQWLLSYEFSTYPTDNHFTNREWPTDSQLRHDSSCATLTFFIHPKCPCTRASIREISRLYHSPDLSQTKKPRLVVYVTIPINGTSDWFETDIFQAASSLPNAEVIMDEGGVEAKKFGAVSSGTCFLFDSNGAKRFAGGVTSSRGHEGDNPGIDYIKQFLRFGGIEMNTTPVFGCLLCLPEIEEPKKHISSSPSVQ